MIHAKDRSAASLSEVKLLWKELVGNLHPEADLFIKLFAAYKHFIDRNQTFFTGEKAGHFKKEIDAIEKIFGQYQKTALKREKRFLLNEATIGLMFTISETIEELEGLREQETLVPLRNAS